MFRDRSNNLFSSITHTREQLHDAELQRHLSTRVLIGTASKVAELKSRYEYDRFAAAIKDKFENNRDANARRSNDNGLFSWSRLGMDVGTLFLCPAGGPGTMMGPISKEETIRKTRERTKKSENVSEMSNYLFQY